MKKSRATTRCRHAAEKIAAAALAISLMSHRGVKRWLAAGNCGPPEPLIRAAVWCRGARQPVMLPKKQLSESNPSRPCEISGLQTTLAEPWKV